VVKDFIFALRKVKLGRNIEKIKYQDEITGLPNRVLFLRKLSEAFTKAKKENTSVALIVLDIDNFKEINKAWGHEKADALLREVALRLRSITRRSDFLARISSDGFGIILISDNPKDAVMRLIERIRTAFSAPVKVDSSYTFISLSFGISVYPNTARTPEELFDEAMTSLLYAKSLGGNKEVFFSKELRKLAQEEAQVRSEFKKALQRGEIFLEYQPKASTKDGSIHSVEGLVRWQKNGKVKLPEEFLPYIEKTGLINELTHYVLEKALRTLTSWRKKNIPLKLAVNLSPREISQIEYIERILLLFARYKDVLPRLEIEITETSLMENLSLVIEFVENCKRLGIDVYIDDFGTGFSSLVYLKKIPIHGLKIDRTFIKDIPESKDDVGIVRAVISLAKTLGVKTVAEGVERKQQLEFLKKEGCDYAQGYYIGKPMREEELLKLLLGELH